MKKKKTKTLIEGEAVVLTKEDVLDSDLKGDDPLEELQKESDKTLFRTKTVFPFTLFPDTIIIDYHKVSIIRKKFFMSESIDSINHGDILHVEAETGPLFSTIKITTKYFSEKPIEIEYLGKKHGVKVRDMLHGLIAARQDDIAFDDVKKKGMAKELEQIGKADVDE